MCTSAKSKPLVSFIVGRFYIMLISCRFMLVFKAIFVSFFCHLKRCDFFYISRDALYLTLQLLLPNFFFLTIGWYSLALFLSTIPLMTTLSFYAQRFPKSKHIHTIGSMKQSFRTFCVFLYFCLTFTSQHVLPIFYSFSQKAPR